MPNANVTASTNSATVAAAAANAAPASGCDQHQRDQQAELRFVRQTTDQYAGEDRPFVEHDQRGADQRGGEKAVMTLPEIDEYRREGDGEQEPEAVACDLLGQVVRNDRVHRQEIKPQRRALPDDQSEPIRHRRQQAGETEKERGIMPAVELRGLAEDRLLAGELLGGVERRRRLAVEYISTGGIDIGKVGAERAAEAVVQAVRGSDQEAGADHEGGEQSESHQPHALAGQPGAGAQNVNKSGHRLRV